MTEKLIQKKDDNLLIIHGRWVIPGGDKETGIIDDGAIVIHGNTINGGEIVRRVAVEKCKS